MIELLPFLSLRYAENIGIAFSLPLTGIFLKLVTLALIFGIIYYYWNYERAKQSAVLNTAFILIISGALGNAWERIFKGYVIDFLSVPGFAVFNLADSYISI